jgi:hypothetical protein
MGSARSDGGTGLAPGARASRRASPILHDKPRKRRGEATQTRQGKCKNRLDSELSFDSIRAEARRGHRPIGERGSGALRVRIPYVKSPPSRERRGGEASAFSR